MSSPRGDIVQMGWKTCMNCGVRLDRRCKKARGACASFDAEAALECKILRRAWKREAASHLALLVLLVASWIFSAIWSVTLYSLLSSTALSTAWKAKSVADMAREPSVSLIPMSSSRDLIAPVTPETALFTELTVSFESEPAAVEGVRDSAAQLVSNHVLVVDGGAEVQDPEAASGDALERLRDLVILLLRKVRTSREERRPNPDAAHQEPSEAAEDAGGGGLALLGDPDQRHGLPRRGRRWRGRSLREDLLVAARGARPGTRREGQLRGREGEASQQGGDGEGAQA
eukprot:CAMPEP_0171178364 /NCGR_PEP_ID=MMETSP0790-20130122/12714_1 /TAXON_ID=2925 /ORGANISM="Alexandrium catenella, Strain OF101" /LENGTH=286 /DNA_ID=CAMNT_0011643285 /DNA_START=36 /DNA_END=896 /DNA_ORIENTATION=+